MEQDASTPPSARQSLAELADWYWGVAELYECEDLDPDDHPAVVVRASTSSDCGQFACAPAHMTG